jgi:hypothetical protein
MMSRYHAYAALVSVTLFVPQVGASQEDDRIYYGSRAGMHLTTVAKQGIGSANATIMVKHTPQDAKAYCVEYEQDNSMACVKRTLAGVKVADRVAGNCIRKTSTDMYGESFVFLGRPNRPQEIMAKYAIRDLRTGNVLDGSSASGYDVELTIFNQLCPGIVR